MIDPDEIVDALVALLKAIPDLVTLVGNDADNIYAYTDEYPDHISLEKAKYEQASPSIMVYSMGTAPGSFSSTEIWKHSIGISVRAGVDDGSGTSSGYYAIFRQFVRGVPTGQTGGETLPLCHIAVHASCHPMDTPTFNRQTDSAGIDYFEISTAFTEIGDD